MLFSESWEGLITQKSSEIRKCFCVIWLDFKKEKTERFSCLKEGAYPFRAGRQGW